MSKHTVSIMLCKYSGWSKYFVDIHLVQDEFTISYCLCIPPSKHIERYVIGVLSLPGIIISTCSKHISERKEAVKRMEEGRDKDDKDEGDKDIIKIRKRRCE